MKRFLTLMEVIDRDSIKGINIREEFDIFAQETISKRVGYLEKLVVIDNEIELWTIRDWDIARMFCYHLVKKFDFIFSYECISVTHDVTIEKGIIG